MKNAFYIIPNIQRTSGGPRTRITLFKSVFEKMGDEVIEPKQKARAIFSRKRFDLCYVESSTNRIALIDVFGLFFMRLRSKEVIIFIRDIYIELFPEEYTSPRAKITLIFNKLSNFYLTLISTSMVFPTKEMGDVFFKKNTLFPKRSYSDLPPGTEYTDTKYPLPDFSKKIGILYLGGTSYANSGFESFLDFALNYQDKYNFYVLSGDKNLLDRLKNTNIILSQVPRLSIRDYFIEKNIAYAIHPRPRNMYDDITFPIKVLDFISFRIPFITEKHIPVVSMISNEYPLYASMEDQAGISEIIEQTTKEKYIQYIDLLQKIALENTYEKRYEKILKR